MHQWPRRRNIVKSLLDVPQSSNTFFHHLTHVPARTHLFPCYWRKIPRVKLDIIHCPVIGTRIPIWWLRKRIVTGHCPLVRLSSGRTQQHGMMICKSSVLTETSTDSKHFSCVVCVFSAIIEVSWHGAGLTVQGWMVFLGKNVFFFEGKRLGPDEGVGRCPLAGLASCWANNNLLSNAGLVGRGHIWHHLASPLSKREGGWD